MWGNGRKWLSLILSGWAIQSGIIWDWIRSSGGSSRCRCCVGFNIDGGNTRLGIIEFGSTVEFVLVEIGLEDNLRRTREKILGHVRAGLSS